MTLIFVCSARSVGHRLAVFGCTPPHSYPNPLPGDVPGGKCGFSGRPRASSTLPRKDTGAHRLCFGSPRGCLRMICVHTDVPYRTRARIRCQYCCQRTCRGHWGKGDRRQTGKHAQSRSPCCRVMARSACKRVPCENSWKLLNLAPPYAMQMYRMQSGVLCYAMYVLVLIWARGGLNRMLAATEAALGESARRSRARIKYEVCGLIWDR